MSAVKINKYIVADPEVCHGKPVFKGTRIMVWQVLELLRDGVPEEKILGYYQTRLKREHIKAALAFAAEITEKRYVSTP